ncbi:MAG: hypothetical protein P4L67_05000 [Candidatus Pacebacteria bacterium]|nr:hypothetical protein [Candidatus Paceibacterota bacterium]
MWLTLAKFAFKIAVMAVSNIPASDWAKLGTVVTTFLQSLQDKLPRDHPAITLTSAWRADRASLQAPKPEAEKWGN